MSDPVRCPTCRHVVGPAIREFLDLKKMYKDQLGRDENQAIGAARDLVHSQHAEFRYCCLKSLVCATDLRVQALPTMAKDALRPTPEEIVDRMLGVK